MRTAVTTVLFALFIVSQALSQAPRGWDDQEDLTLDKTNMDLITFGLKEINGVEYTPVKILSKITEANGGITTTLVVVVDNGRNKIDSRKIVQLTIWQYYGPEKMLINWEVIDATLSYTPLTDDAILNQIIPQINNFFAQKREARYDVKVVLSAFQSQTFGAPFYYVKVMVESTGNSLEAHEFVFAKRNLKVFYATKLPTSRKTLQVHPHLDLLSGKNGLNCTNLSSPFFCELAPNCVNKMFTTGVCEAKH